MLGGLERADAPKDFNFQLKARIARTQPNNYQTRFFPALRYVLPLGFVVVLLSFIALSGLYFVDKNSIAPVAIKETPTPAANVALPANKFIEEKQTVSENLPFVEEIPVGKKLKPIERQISDKQTTAFENKNQGRSKDLLPKSPKVLLPNEKNPGGGSNDSALTNPEVITPPEFDTNRVVNSTVNPDSATVGDVNELLKTIGIVANSLKVVSVGKNSPAGRSGIKAGDILEAVDGKKITDDALRGKQLDIKTLTVLRDGERLEIVLQNK